MKREQHLQKGITTPVLIGLVVAGLVVIGVLVYILQQQETLQPEEPEDRAMEKQEESENKEGEEMVVDLNVEEILEGEGQAVVPGDVVRVHYTGTFQDGTKFDSSYDHGQPFEVQVGVGQVIQGWDLGLQGMKAGGKRKLVIPPELAYGEAGTPDEVIPPNTTLYFEIELLEILDIKG